MGNSADPDHMAQKPTDLDLHCLQRQGISWFSRTMVKSAHMHSHIRPSIFIDRLYSTIITQSIWADSVDPD